MKQTALKLKEKTQPAIPAKSKVNDFQELRGTPNGSLVHRFITAGKPGSCSFCGKIVAKLEAHHVQYRPEATIKICHDCHHRAHFFPLRLSQQEKYKMFKLIRPEKEAAQLAADKTLKNEQLARMIAPSRSGFVRAQQKAFAETGEERVARETTPNPTGYSQRAASPQKTHALLFNKRKKIGG